MFKTQSIESLSQIANCLDNPSYAVKGKIKDVISLLHTDAWPLAVPTGLIVQDDDQAKLRARSILYSFDIVQSANKQSLMDEAPVKFLDYGCGAGHVTVAALEADIDAYGYDITKQWDADHPKLSTDFEVIKQNGPYTHILLYDVIDHTNSDDEIMRSVASLSNPQTKVIVRTHPWTSRHGAHTYYKLNRAYAHLFVSQEQLQQYTDQRVNRLTRPVKYYTDLFEKTNFKVESTNMIKKPLEQFFDIEEINVILRELFNADKDWLNAVLPIEFIDYQLIGMG